MHEQSVHGSRKYLCNSCNFQANTADDLRTHQKSVHIKGKFKCDQCDIDFSHKESISKHKESIQEKIMYPMLINITIVSLNSLIRYILQCTSSQFMAVENIFVILVTFKQIQPMI